MPSENRKIPSSAFQLAASAFQLAGDSVKDGTGVTKTPISMLARGSDPIPHWYFGMLSHELSGLKHKDRIPIDEVHDEQSVLGYLDSFNIQEDGLHVSGFLVSTQAGDKADTIAKQMRAGVPYEASIDFNGYPYKIEELGAGHIATVNGKQMTGPAYIFREAPLRGVALCPYGADQSTRSNLAALSQNAQQVEIEIQTQETEKMSEIPASTSAASAEAEAAAKLAASNAQSKLDLLDKLTADYGATIAVAALKADNPEAQAAKLKREADKAEIDALKADNAKLAAQSTGGRPAKFGGSDPKKKMTMAEACFGKAK